MPESVSAGSLSHPAPSHIRIELLGGVRVYRDSRQIDAPVGKTQQLLVLVLLEPNTAQPRERLAELLWPDLPPERSRRNLSDTLYRLRQSLAGDWLVADATTLTLNPDADLTVDVWELAGDRTLADAPSTSATSETQAAHRVALYRGPLVPDLYEDWITPYRTACHEQYLSALLTLATLQEESLHLDAAYQTLLRALQADPLREAAYCQAMRVLAKLNRLPDALNLYDRLVDVLEREVAAPPAPETRGLADTLFRELDALRRAAQPDAHAQRRPRFVGRQTERSTLLSLVEAAIGGQGAAAVIEGVAGMGKTRLLEEIESGANWRGATVLWGRADARPGTSSLAPLAAAVTSALAGPRAAQIATLLDATTLAALGPLYPPWESVAPLVDLPPEQARRRFLQAFTTLMATLCELNPLVLILDDLHWADPSLWLLVDALVNQVGAWRLALLLSYRREEVETGPGWTFVQKWEREQQARLVRLTPLDRNAVAELLGPEQSVYVDTVWAGSGGTPFFVVEALDALAAGEPVAETIPAARLDDLSASARRALDLAAIVGREIPYSILAAGVDLAPRALIAATDELVARHLLVPVNEGHRFIHDLVQAAAYEQVTPPARRVLHTQVAQILAQTAPHNFRSRAFHLEQAGDLAAAGALYVEAARQETARFAFAEAQAALVKALAYLDDAASPARTELLLELARLANLAGDVDETDAALQSALAAAQTLQRADLELTSRVQLADLAARTGRHDAAETEFAAAWQLAQSQDDGTAQLAVLLPRADFRQRLGQYEAAREDFDLAIELARTHNDRDREGRALEGMGWVLAGLGHPASTVVDYFEQALAAHAAGGNRFEEARTRLNLFSALQSAGKWDRLLALEQPMLEGLRQVSYRRGEASAWQAICWVRLGLGDLDAAHAAGLQARALFEEIGEQMGVSLAISALGAILTQQGRLAEAEPWLVQALGITQELGSDAFEAYAHHELGAFYLAQHQAAAAEDQLRAAIERWHRVGDPFNLVRSQTRLAQSLLHSEDTPEKAPEKIQEARTLATAAWEHLQSGMPDSNNTLDWLLSLHDLLAALGEAERAHAAISRAYAALLEQACAIDDLELRQQFMEAVSVNRAICLAFAQVDPQTDTRSESRGESARAPGNKSPAGLPPFQTMQTTLARLDAPLGRPLAPDEMVNVAWTVAAPTDATIANPAERRRFVLQRLHREAQAQHAAPTDDDLAQALGVSRRTILRDIQALHTAGIVIATRARTSPASS